MENEAIKYIATVHEKPTIFDQLLHRQPTVWCIAHCNRLVSIDRVGDALHFLCKERAVTHGKKWVNRFQGRWVSGIMEVQK